MHGTGPPEKKMPPTLKSTASSSSEQVPCFCKAHPAFCGNHRGVRTRLARRQVPDSRCRKFWTTILSKFFQKSIGAIAPNFGNCRGAQQIISHRGTETQSCQRMALRAKHGSMEHKYPSIGATAPNFGSCRGAQQIISHRGTETQSCQRMALRAKHGSMEVCCAWASKNFPSPPGAVPNLVRRGEAARPMCRRMGLAPMRRHQGRWLAQRDGAPVSQFRRGSALCASVSLCEASLSCGSSAVAPCQTRQSFATLC